MPVPEGWFFRSDSPKRQLRLESATQLIHKLVTSDIPPEEYQIDRIELETEDEQIINEVGRDSWYGIVAVRALDIFIYEATEGSRDKDLLDRLNILWRTLALMPHGADFD